MTAVDPSPVPSAEAAPVRLVLASASPARRKLLEDSRIAFTVRVSSVDEDAALAAANERARAEGREGLSPAETASLLASLKARAVAEELAAEGVRDALVLGCDSVFEFEGRAYGKPHTAENARERITARSTRVTRSWICGSSTPRSMRRRPPLPSCVAPSCTSMS